MRSSLIIARLTFKEIMRDRILYGLVVFAVLVIGLSLVLGELSFNEQNRVSINFGLTAMHLGMVVLSIFVGASLVSKELEKRTILTLLVHPLSRSEFLVGKFLGLSAVITLILVGLALTMSLLLKSYGLVWDSDAWVALLGMLLEAFILLGFALFFGSFLRPILTVVFSMSFFLIGHWLDSLHFFASTSSEKVFVWFNAICQRVLPNLERFNWRSFANSDLSPPVNLIVESSVYGLCWAVFLVSLTCIIFSRRDFV